MSPRLAVLLCASTLGLASCGGTKVVKEPQPLQIVQPLAEAADAQIGASLDWVVVRNGNGAWAKNADWDQYHLRVRNTSGAPVQVTDIVVFDSLGTRLQPQRDRKQLVRSSRENVRRYRDSGLKIHAGAGGTGLIVAGAATTVGMSAAYAAAATYGAGWGGAAGGMTAAGAGLLLAGPAVIAAGIVRVVNNTKVNNRILALQATLPLTVDAGGTREMILFYPIAPAPDRVQVSYRDAQGEHQLDIDTTRALGGLHLPPSPGKGAAAAAPTR